MKLGNDSTEKEMGESKKKNENISTFLPTTSSEGF